MAKRIRKRRENPQFQFNINNRIRPSRVRLVGENMDEISSAAGRKIEAGNIHDTRDLLSWSRDLGLDVVEISPNADPPVVRIVDFNKFLYEKKKKQKELKAKTQKTVIKEIRFGPNTDDHDFNFKLNHAKKFLTDGAKVKAYVHFKGRTIVFKDRGKLLLLKFLAELEELGGAEQMPKMEGRRMIVIISPKKKK